MDELRNALLKGNPLLVMVSLEACFFAVPPATQDAPVAIKNIAACARFKRATALFDSEMRAAPAGEGSGTSAAHSDIGPASLDPRHIASSVHYYLN